MKIIDLDVIRAVSEAEECQLEGGNANVVFNLTATLAGNHNASSSITSTLSAISNPNSNSASNSSFIIFSAS